MKLFKKEKLITYRLEIHGMMCGMCESHINDAIRLNFPVKKVRSKRLKNETVIETRSPLDEEQIAAVIAKTGYELKKIERV